MIRHDLHRQDLKRILRCDQRQHDLQFLIDTTCQDLLPVLRTPYDMILQRINIPTTICKALITDIINTFIHIFITPCENNKGRQKIEYVFVFCLPLKIFLAG